MRTIAATILTVLAGLYGMANAVITAVAYAQRLDATLPAVATIGSFAAAFVFALSAE